MRNLIRKPLSGSVSIIASALVLLLFALGAVAFSGAYAIATGEIRRDAEGAARAVEHHVRSLLQSAETAIDAMLQGRGPAVEAAAHPPRNHGGASNLIAPQGATMLLMDATGRVIDSSVPTAIGLNLSDRAYFRTHVEQRLAGPYVGAPFAGRLTGLWFFPISKALRGPNGELQGVAAALLDPRQLSEMVQALELGPNSVVALLRRDGAVLARFPVPAKDARLSLPETIRLPVDAAAGTLDGVEFAAGVRGSFSYRTLAPWRLVVGVGIDQSVALAAFWRASRAFGLALATLIVAASCAAYFLVRSHRAVRAAQDAAARAGRAREAFFAEMSHELRTPLNAIIGFSETMRTEMMGPLSPRYREYARDIQMSGELLLDLVDALLDAAALHSDDASVGQEAFCVAGATMECLDTVKPSARAAGVELEAQVESELGTVRGDQRRYKRMLVNLLSGFVNAAAQGSSISVRAERRSADELAVIVAASGSGRQSGAVQAARRPFDQLESAMAADGGMRLGLALAKAYAERQGGRFELSGGSELGLTASSILPATSDGDGPTRLAA